MNVEFFINNFITKNKPVVFRNFLQKDTPDPRKVEKEEIPSFDFAQGNECSIQEMTNFVNTSKFHCLNYGCKLTEKHHLLCKHLFLNNLYQHYKIIKNSNIRVWKHQKGHFTRNHYDANLINILNI